MLSETKNPRDERDISNLQMLMLDFSQCLSIILSSEIKAIECNRPAIEYLGYASKEALLTGFMPDLLSSIPPFQPDASPTIPFDTRIQYVIQHGEHEFEMEIVLHGRRAPLRFMLRRVDREDDFVIICSILDTHSLKEARNDLIRSDLLMRQVNRAATKLLAASPETFDAEMVKTLKSLCQGVNASQMSILENYTEDGVFGCRLLCSGSIHAAVRQAEADARASVNYADIPDWYDILAEGKTVNERGSALPASGREAFFPRGTKVFALIPVFQQKSFWGIILIAKSANDQLFTKTEERAIQSGGIISVTAILRNQINKNLMIAHEKAMASEKAKGEFLSRMSHEIRTPLNAIIGMTAVAKKLSDFEQIKHTIEKVELASSQLLYLVNDILDMSKIEAGKLEIVSQPFDLMAMLQRVVEIHKAAIEGKNQTLTMAYQKEFNRYITTDELRLSQVMTNLISNAIKFTGDGGEIKITVDYYGAGESGENRLRVAVQDNGIGITEEQQSRLFQSFEQADGSITRRFGGSGLGLAICRNIVELLGGSIRVESNRDGGSNFIFEIMFTWGELLTAQAKIEDAESTAPRYCWKGMHILLAEDIEINREIVLALLADTELEITCAENGQQALTLFSQAPEKYALIMMDVQMPIMDGLEATRQIRKLDTQQAGSIPIIAMTANAFSSDRERCMEAGMTGYISKPIDTKAMLSTLALHLQGEECALD